MYRRLLALSVNLMGQHCLRKKADIRNLRKHKAKIDHFIRNSSGEENVHHKEESVPLGNSDAGGTFQQNPQELIIVNALNRSEPLKADEWALLYQEVLSCKGHLKSTTLDAYIMSQCVKNCNLKAGLSLLTYLETSTSGPNIATVSAFFRLWHACRGHPEERELLSRYNKLRQQYPLLDAATCGNAAVALSYTTRWREAFDLLDMIKLTHHPKSAVYTSLAAAAFRHGDAHLARSVLEESFESADRRPGPEAYLAWLQYDDSEQLLNFIATHGDKPTDKVANALAETLESKGGLQANFTTISKRGICQSCGTQLMSQPPTQSEFKLLQEAMMDRVLLSGDVFLKTSPQELTSFQEMLKKSNTWNVVIDGLNVALASGSTSGSIRAKLLLLVVEHFLQQGKKILVLGREHMKRWPRQQMTSISNHAQLFLADNLSQDDPLVLLAALHSGLGTNIVSRDLMRTHMFLLKDKELRKVFRRWQYSHQCFFEVKNNSRVIVKDPLKFYPFAQQHGNGSWHIPYEVATSSPNKRYSHLDVPEHWLCLSKK